MESLIEAMNVSRDQADKNAHEILMKKLNDMALLAKSINTKANLIRVKKFLGHPVMWCIYITAILVFTYFELVDTELEARLNQDLRSEYALYPVIAMQLIRGLVSRKEKTIKIPAQKLEFLKDEYKKVHELFDEKMKMGDTSKDVSVTKAIFSKASKNLEITIKKSLDKEKIHDFSSQAISYAKNIDPKQKEMLFSAFGKIANTILEKKKDSTKKAEKNDNSIIKQDVDEDLLKEKKMGGKSIENEKISSKSDLQSVLKLKGSQAYESLNLTPRMENLLSNSQQNENSFETSSILTKNDVDPFDPKFGFIPISIKQFNHLLKADVNELRSETDCELGGEFSSQGIQQYGVGLNFKWKLDIRFKKRFRKD